MPCGAVRGWDMNMMFTDKATTAADWDSLNPNSLETECRDSGMYFTKEWRAGDKVPEVLVCPKCGSDNHGGVGSPAGGMHLALWDPELPCPPSSPASLHPTHPFL